jgi:hypothetical protein
VVTSRCRLAAERIATLGPTHPDTIDARERHAHGHRWLGRRNDEIRLTEEMLAGLDTPAAFMTEAARQGRLAIWQILCGLVA